MWKMATVSVGDKKYWCEIKQYSAGSGYGLGGGRISKLSVRSMTDKNEIVMLYDRGWDKKPSTEEEWTVLNELISIYN